jgi:hypothetical protein
MNSNLFQTILTVLLTACGVVTSILLALGCTQDVTGAINCAASSAPEWLVPWLVVAASALGIVKLITGAITGKLVAPTAVVSKSGAPGTVHPERVAK